MRSSIKAEYRLLVNTHGYEVAKGLIEEEYKLDMERAEQKRDWALEGIKEVNKK